MTTEMGSRSGVSMAPLTRKTCQDYGMCGKLVAPSGEANSLAGVLRSVSQAWRIGRAIALCRKKNEISRIPKAILELQNGACLFIGKIINVNRVSETLNLVSTRVIRGRFRKYGRASRGVR